MRVCEAISEVVPCVHQANKNLHFCFYQIKLINAKYDGCLPFQLLLNKKKTEILFIEMIHQFMYDTMRVCI